MDMSQIHEILELLNNNTIEIFLKNYYETTFSIAVLLGMFGHYCKKKLKQETEANITGWFGTANLYATFAAFTTALLTITGAIANHVVTVDTDLMTLIYTGLTTGFAVDSMANSD